MLFHMFCLCFVCRNVSSFKSFRAGSQVFTLLLFLCVLLHTMSSGKSLQLLCIFPFGMLCFCMISGEYVCCIVVFCTLVGAFVFRVMWSEFLMTYVISCPLWSSVYECQRVECAFTSPVRTLCGMFVMYCMQCCRSVSAVL